MIQITKRKIKQIDTIVLTCPLWVSEPLVADDIQGELFETIDGGTLTYLQTKTNSGKTLTLSSKDNEFQTKEIAQQLINLSNNSIETIINIIDLEDNIIPCRFRYEQNEPVKATPITDSLLVENYNIEIYLRKA